MTLDERPIALVGIMGAGKTAVARVLGERLAVPVADLDSMIEAEEGCTIAELFERQGEPHFRRREGEMLVRALVAGARVIACGGGIVVDAGSRQTLRQRCHVVWLDVSPADAAARIAHERTLRPLLAGGAPVERLAQLATERAALYGVTAEARVETDGRTAEQVADEVLRVLGRGPDLRVHPAPDARA